MIPIIHIKIQDIKVNELFLRLQLSKGYCCYCFVVSKSKRSRQAIGKYTDKNIFDDSYQLVTHFPDFPLWENRIAYFK